MGEVRHAGHVAAERAARATRGHRRAGTSRPVEMPRDTKSEDLTLRPEGLFIRSWECLLSCLHGYGQESSSALLRSRQTSELALADISESRQGLAADFLLIFEDPE